MSAKKELRATSPPTPPIFSSSHELILLRRYGRDFFPGSGGVGEVGRGEGAGRTVNVPWMQTGLGDADYVAAFELLVLPILHEFRPQLLLVSAGFDAALGDVQGKMAVSAAGFGSMMRLLLELAASLGDCKPVVLLEGGYHLETSAECVEAVLIELLADAHAAAAGPSRAFSVAGRRVHGPLGTHTETLLREVIRVQWGHWACLREPAYAAAVDEYFGTTGPRTKRKRAS